MATVFHGLSSRMKPLYIAEVCGLLLTCYREHGTYATNRAANRGKGLVGIFVGDLGNPYCTPASASEEGISILTINIAANMVSNTTPKFQSIQPHVKLLTILPTTDMPHLLQQRLYCLVRTSF